MYLNGLDQFVKHQRKCRCYVRYCDNFVLLSRDRDELIMWRERIAKYLRDAKTAALLGLSRMKKNRRGALYGFPGCLLGGSIFRLMRHGRSVIVVREKESVGGGLKVRAPVVGYEAGD